MDNTIDRVVKMVEDKNCYINIHPDKSLDTGRCIICPKKQLLEYSQLIQYNNIYHTKIDKNILNVTINNQWGNINYNPFEFQKYRL